MPVSYGKKGVAEEMRKYKHGTLHSGSKHGPIVRDRKQAVAIAMHEAGMSKKSHHSPGMGTGQDVDSFRGRDAQDFIAGDIFTDGSVGGTSPQSRTRPL